MSQESVARVHCSHCLERHSFTLVEEGSFSRSLSRCDGCGGLGVRCRGPRCTAMARVEEPPPEVGGLKKLRGRVHREFCSAHAGELWSWEAYGAKLDDVTSWQRLKQYPRTTNLKRTARYVGVGIVTLGGAGAIATAGPALVVKAGAAKLLGKAGTGVAISSLKGAALKSASVAKIGTLVGAPAGSKVAAGTVVSMAAVGGVAGWRLGADGHELVRALRCFDVVDCGGSPAEGVQSLFINGLFSENAQNIDDWLQGGLRGLVGARRWVKWDANRWKSLLSVVLPPLPTAPGTAWVRAWKGAQRRTAEVACLLADLIARTPPERTYRLFGHSLGGRIALLTMAELGRRGHRRIAGSALLGAATPCHDPEVWDLATRSLADGASLVNAWSRRDHILQVVFRGAERGALAAGCAPVPNAPAGVCNVDCTDIVPGHMQWKAHGGAVLDRAGA